MATFIIKSPAPIKAQQSQSTPTNNNPPPNTYQAALLELGDILLRKESKTPWLSLKKLSAKCRRHAEKLPLLNYSVKCLGDWANEYFPKSGEIRDDKVKVVYKTESTWTKEPAELHFQFCRI